MEIHENPLIQPEDYLKGYRDSVEALKNNPHLLMFDKLTYELFASEIGKQWLEIVTERFLIPSLTNRESANYSLMTIWADGFKDFPRMIKQHILSHQQRIQAEGR